MSAKIFYFSGTGNSLKVSKDIAKELGDTELVSIAKIMEDNRQIDLDADAVGIVFPVYAWGMPRIVGKFLNKVITDKYVFIVITSGSSSGYTILNVKKVLGEKGTKVSSAFEIHMPDNYIPMSNGSSEEKKKELFTKQQVKIKEIADIIRLKNVHQPDIKRNFKNSMLSGPISKLALKNFSKMDKSFWTNDKCNNCKVCSKICPVKNIELKDEKPIWKHNCEACMACIHWCPTEAIQFGKNSEKRNRYTHPDIELHEMLKRDE